MDIGGEAKTTGTTEKRDTTRTRAGEKRERLDISDEAIDKIMEDLLSKAGSGIKDIFGAEQVAGIFDSTVSAQASGDLVANIVGEIAKLRAERVTTTDETEEEKIRGKSRTTELGTSFKIFG